MRAERTLRARETHGARHRWYGSPRASRRTPSPLRRARRRGRDPQRREYGGRRRHGRAPRRVDLFDAAAVRAAVDGCDAIAHLATNVPPMRQMRKPDAWATHNRLRADATRHLLDVARDVGITRVVKESITFTYPDCGDRWIDEDTPIEGVAPLLEPTVVGDRMVLDFVAEGREGRAPPIRLLLLRRRPFHGRIPPGRAAAPLPGAGVARRVRELDPRRRRGRGRWSAPSMLRRAPTTSSTTSHSRAACYTDAFAAAFGLGRLGSTPAWMLRAVVGRSSERTHVVATRRRSARCRRMRSTGCRSTLTRRRGWVVVAATARQAGAAITGGLRRERTDDDGGADRPDRARGVGRVRRCVGRLRAAVVLRRLPGARAALGVGRRPVQRAPRA